MPHRREFLKFLAVSPLLTDFSASAQFPQAFRSFSQLDAHLTDLDHIRRAQQMSADLKAT